MLKVNNKDTRIGVIQVSLFFNLNIFHNLF